MKNTNRATFEITQIEVGTGNGYRWVTAFYIIKPDGTKIYPPMIRSEAIAYCKREGWDHRAIIGGSGQHTGASLHHAEFGDSPLTSPIE